MTDRSLNLLMATLHIKQARVYLEYLLSNHKQGLKGKVKSKWDNTIESLKAADNFFELDDDEATKYEKHELSAAVSNINRYLMMYPDLALDVERSIEECLKQEKRL